MNKTVVIIGEFELITKCAQILYKNGFKIVFICSKTSSLKKWAREKNISVVQDVDEFYSNMLKTEVEYLFSLQNAYIIPPNILQNVKKLAINYHNSLLPKYGGNENNVCWMIWNNEKYGGVTWHVLDKTIDGGAILKQAKFEISQVETALSLLLKCQNYAISTFVELVSDLVLNKITQIVQDVQERSYFFSFDRPCGFALIDFNNTAETIYRQFRALDFGTQKPPIETLKFIYDNIYYYVQKLEVLTSKTKNVKNGTIVHIDNNKIQVVTNSYDIEITYYPILLTKNEYPIQLNIVLEQEKCVLSKQIEIATKMAKDKAYWTQQLSEFNPHKNFIQEPSNVYFDLIEKQTIKFNQLITSSTNTTINDIQSLILAYLYKVNNYDMFSVCIAGKYVDILSNTYAKNLFLPFKPLNINFKEEHKFDNIHKQVIKLFFELEKHSACSLDVLLHNPEYKHMIDSNILILNFGTFQDFSRLGLYNCPIVINIDEINQTLSLFIAKNFEYPLFLDFINDHLITLANKWKYDNKKLSEVCLLSKQEINYLKSWNNTKVEYPHQKSLGDLIDNACEKYPDHIALESIKKTINYKTLKKQTDIVAENILQALSQNNICSGTVGLFLDKSVDTIITMLAILKTGFAYVVLDTKYPDEYLQHIIEDSKLQIIISDAININRLATSFNHIELQEPRNVLLLENLFIENTITHLPVHIPSDSLAYIIFTSGSTGKPKGVMIKHSSVVNLAYAVIANINLTFKDKVLQFSTLAFDACVWEIYSTLLAGATLYVPDQTEIIIGNDIQNTIISKNISCVTLPTSVLAIQPFFLSLYLRIIVVAGEECSKSIIKIWSSHYTLINAYGPTESTVCTSMTYPLRLKNIDNITIGKPIQNCNVTICDQYQCPMVIGAIGEIIISGAGVAKGYLDETEKVLQFRKIDSIDVRSNSYLSGDLAKWTNDGEIKYIGRKNSQIKIRGFRVELEAIETIMVKYPGIRACSVLLTATSDNHNILNAYILPLNQSVAFKLKDIRDFLAQKLPDFCIPNNYFILDKWPLNIAGKFDYKNLLKNTNIKLLTNDIQVLPHTKIQKEIAIIWQDILKTNKDSIDIETPFSTFGGTSLQITQMILKLQKVYEVSISFADFLSLPTIKHLEKLIIDRSSENNNLILAVEDIMNLKKIGFKKPNFQGSSIIKKILLTGVTGFLGAYLAKYFLENNIEVFCLIRGDKLMSSTKLYTVLRSYNWKKEDIDKLNIINGDISLERLGIEETLYAKLCNEIDLVCNSAAFVHHLYSYKELRETNVYGVKNCIEFALIGKIKKFVHISTESILSNIKAGIAQEKLIDESDLILTKIDGYNSSKIAAELYINHAVKNSNLNVKIYRPSWISGDSVSGVFPYQNNHLFLLLKSCLQLKCAPDVDVLINLTPVDYIAKFIVLDVLNNNKWGQALNMIANDDISLKELINYFAKTNKIKVEFIHSAIWQNKIKNISPQNALYSLLPLYLMPINNNDKSEPHLLKYNKLTDLQNIKRINNLYFLDAYKKLGLPNFQIYKLLPIYHNFFSKVGFISS